MSLYFSLFLFFIHINMCVCVDSVFFNVHPLSHSNALIFIYPKFGWHLLKFLYVQRIRFFIFSTKIYMCVCILYRYVFFCAAYCCCVRVSWEYKNEWAGKNRQTSTHAEPSSNSSAIAYQNKLKPNNNHCCRRRRRHRHHHHHRHQYHRRQQQHETKTTSTTISMGAIKKSIQNIKKSNTHTHTQPYIHLNFRYTQSKWTGEALNRANGAEYQ